MRKGIEQAQVRKKKDFEAINEDSNIRPQKGHQCRPKNDTKLSLIIPFISKGFRTLRTEERRETNFFAP